MGLLDFLFKKKYNSKNIPYPNENYDDYKEPDLNKIYSNKGISNIGDKNPKKPWLAAIYIDKRGLRKNGKIYSIHIGYFTTKEEAQKARWEYIENLK